MSRDANKRMQFVGKRMNSSLLAGKKCAISNSRTFLEPGIAYLEMCYNRVSNQGCGITTSTITVDMMDRDCEITLRCSALSSAVGSHPDTLIPLNSTFQRSSGLMISDTVVQEFEDHSQWIHDGIDAYRASPYGTFPSSYPGSF